jgi:hypothetical protein
VSVYELIDSDPVIEECDATWCDGGTVGDRYCRTCGGDGFKVFDRSALFTLAHNLATAGALWAVRNGESSPAYAAALAAHVRGSKS